MTQTVVAPPPGEYLYDVFVSYSHEDADWVYGWLLPRLEAAGLSICIDRRTFDVGRHSVLNMQNAVAASRCTLLVLTPAWVQSEWTDFEALMAYAGDPGSVNQRTIPVLREPCSPPLLISRLSYTDLTDAADVETSFQGLLAALRGRRRLPDPVGPPIHWPPLPRTGAGPVAGAPQMMVTPTTPAPASTGQAGWRAATQVTESLERALTTLTNLTELLRAPEIQAAVAASLVDLAGLREQIADVTGLKELHDQLHELEIGCFSLLEPLLGRPLDDELVEATLVQAHLALQSVVAALLEIAGGPGNSRDRKWIDELVEAEEALNLAREESDGARLAEAVRGMRGVIGRQSPRVNARLMTAAEGVRLHAVVDAMGRIVADLETVDVEAEKVAHITRGYHALVADYNALEALLRDHGDWQDVYDELRTFDAEIARDVEDTRLPARWPRLKVETEPLYLGSTDSSAQRFARATEKLDASLQAGNPAALRRAWREYYKSALLRFWQVDKTLRDHLIRLQSTGNELTTILRIAR